MAGNSTDLGCFLRVVCCHKCRNCHKIDTTSPNVSMKANSDTMTSIKSGTSHKNSGTNSGENDVSDENGTSDKRSADSADTGGSQEKKMVIATHDFKPIVPEDLKFKKGDKMQILDKSDDNFWWKAKHLKTKKEGNIPSSFVASLETVHCEEWFHGKMLRVAAEIILTTPGIGNGTFLIRESESIKENYALSLLHWDGTSKNRVVKHYMIKVFMRKYMIKEPFWFSSLKDLVTHYSANPSGLPTRLTTPCQKLQPQLWDLSSRTKDVWEVNRNDVLKEELLGQGHYGEVWLGKYLGARIAIKTLKPGMMTPEAFVAEATIMKSLQHENLMSLYAICSKEEPIWIITEYMPNGSLVSYLQSQQGRNLDFSVLLDMAAKIADGMRYIESRQLLHRDLAARNVLVGDNNRVKITDFGLARVVQDGIYEMSGDYKLPVKWTAPEVLNYQICSIKSDVWSFGIVLTEIVTYGGKPYEGMTNNDVQRRVSEGYRMPPPSHHLCPEPLYDLMKECWQEERDKRPSFDYLYSFLIEFDVNKQQYDQYR